MTATSTCDQSRTHRPHAPRRLDGMRALVTGGGRGLGRAVALAFADAGAQVGLLARSDDELAESVRLIETTGGVATFVTADVRDHCALSAAVTRLRDRLG